MLRQPLLSTRLATLSLAVSALLFATTGNTAVIGKTKINSKQHEPLSASIDVSDIDPESFSVSVANDLLYQQMGMNPDIPINVTFVKTSDSTGKLLLSSPQPVSAPFADVVLVVNDKGRAQSLPKTLLLPINKNKQVANTAPTVVGTAPTPDLPKVEASTSISDASIQASNQPSDNPVVSQEPPAALTTTNDQIAANSALPKTNAAPSSSNSSSSNIVSTPSFPSQQDFLKSESTATSSSEISGTQAAIAQPADNVNTTPQRPEFNAQNQADKQADILSTQITRTYKAIDNSNANASNSNISNPNASNSIASSNVYPNTQNKEQQASATSSQPVLDTNANTPNKMTDAQDVLNAENTVTPTNNTPAANKNMQASSAKPKVAIPLGNATYKVQRNDNLWTIALQISKKNNIDVYTVMDQIQAYNPDAFINGDKSRLLANTKLALPAYRVIPSKLGMQAAAKSRKSTSKSKRSSQNVTAKAKRKTSNNKSRKSTKSSRTQTTASAAKPRLKLVTPTKQGKATGTATKSTPTTTSAGVNASLIATLEAARKNAAQQAQLVSGINASLAERARKLQFYNQKLAELEKRLKELRGN